MNTNDFSIRHIGPRLSDYDAMLKTIGVSSLNQLINETIPDNIKLQKELDWDEPMSEFEIFVMNSLKKMGIPLLQKIKVAKYILQKKIKENKKVLDIQNWVYFKNLKWNFLNNALYQEKMLQ